MLATTANELGGQHLRQLELGRDGGESCPSADGDRGGRWKNGGGVRDKKWMRVRR